MVHKVLDTRTKMLSVKALLRHAVYRLSLQHSGVLHFAHNTYLRILHEPRNTQWFFPFPSLNYPGGGEIFRIRPDRSWGLPSLQYNGYPVSLPGVKRPRRGLTHPPPSSAEVKERVQLYLYFPTGPSRPVPGWTLPVTEPHFRTRQNPSAVTDSLIFAMEIQDVFW